MAATNVVLRIQSDQILDDPQFSTRVRLKGLLATNTLNLVWDEPAAGDWDLQFKDPGANDAVVYENLVQPLNNKTLGTPAISDFTNAQHDHSDVVNGGAVLHSSLGSPAVGDDHTQYALLAGRIGGQTLIGGSAATENLSLQSTSDATRGEIVAIDDLRMGVGKEVLGLPLVPSGATAAASKAYVDMAVTGGTAWKETLLVVEQLDDTNAAIANAGAFYLVNVAALGDTFTLNDGVTNETWTYAGVSAAFQPAIGASAFDSMTDLVARINTDSTVWAARLATSLQGINPAGDVVVVYRQVPTSTTTDRMYGVFTTPADAQYVDFGAEIDYLSSTTAQLPSVDPATANFGFGRITADLVPNEAHQLRQEDASYTWNQDAAMWQPGAGALSLATSAPGGGTTGAITADENLGLEIAGGGILQVKVDGTSTAFNTSGQLAAPTSRLMTFAVFNIVGGAVSGDTSPPDYSTDFQAYDVMTSVSPGGRIDVCYEGRLGPGETKITSIDVPIVGAGASAQYQLKVFVEGSGTTNVYTSSALNAAPGSRTVISLTDADLSAQPTGEKRYYVVVEAHIDASESVSVGRPYVGQF